MLEKVGNKDIIVRNYTDNSNVKEYVQEVLIPEAFPNIPMNKLNLGFTGVISEYMGQVIEDTQAEASLMLNESFVSRAVLPSSIYADAAVYNIGYRFATPSSCTFAVEIKVDDVLNDAELVPNTYIHRYILDKNTKLVMGDVGYKFDYDVYIDYTKMNGKNVYNVYYNMEESNSMSSITNKYIKHQVTSTGWLVMFVDLKEFDRKTDTSSITDNIVTTNSEIEISWTRQIAGLDVVYISPQGQRLSMVLKEEYTDPEVEPFVWYRFIDDNTIGLSFTSNTGYWTPDFNSKIEYTIYTTAGASSNFTSYDRDTNIPVKKVGDNYPYNADATIVGVCFSGSTGGADRGDIEQLRSDVILARNTVDVLTTDNDLAMWFDNYGKVYGTKAKFFKRRDDPSGRLFSQFIAIMDDTYVYPTNTLGIEVTQSEFDYVNSTEDGTNQEFIIKPGHIWEYKEDSRNVLVMVDGTDGKAMITDDAIPLITTDRPYMFVNPFFIKVYKEPTTSIMYNSMINNTSWPEDEEVNTDCFYQFQLGTMSVERTISTKYKNMYHISVLCVPVVTTDTSVTYIEGIGEDYPVSNNSLRLVLVTRTSADGDTGYIEMEPTEQRDGGAYLFETDIAVYDNLGSDMMLQVDMDRTPGMRSLIGDGSRAGKVYMDSQETSFTFVALMKGTKSGTSLYNDDRYTGYMIANKFHNAKRDLDLFKAMSMMRSSITFSGTNDDYTMNMTLVPFLRWDIPLDDEKMEYFTQAFAEQYKRMEPVLSKLDGNSFLDLKLYNTYGKSSNYYIGPEDGVPAMRDSTILLDNVYVNVNLVISVYDRSLYSQTVSEVINEITQCFDDLNADENSDIYVSDIIHDVIENNPNVRYLRFIGFNDYDANKQCIFVKYSDISELHTETLMTRVPEMIIADSGSITITEET